ncbi:MAG: ABC transporter ATP-binding protein, partial [Oscillospiraceae bacterium]|nr:ABC transporter ATP-binding protein [Oscillospiraceae bacterium]
MSGKSRKSPVAGRILRYTKPCAALLAPAVIAAVVSVMLSLYTPVLVGRGIDYIIGENNVDFDGVKRYVLMIAATVALSAVFSWVMSYCTYKITYRAVSDLRCELYEKLNKVPLNYIDSSSRGDIISRMSVDVEQISDGML